jgi:hypothetical protein
VTPPAIAPEFELLLEALDGDDDEVAPGVGKLLVELGTVKALPVTSGESVMEPISTAHKDGVRWYEYLPPALCANDAFQKPDYGRSEND